jgi:hypothetical protein
MHNFGKTNSICVTATRLYVEGTDGTREGVASAPLNNDTSWTYQFPAGFSSTSAHEPAVTYDGKNYIIIDAQQLGGVWRYVEPATGTGINVPTTANSARIHASITAKRFMVAGSRLNLSKEAASGIKALDIYDINGKLLEQTMVGTPAIYGVMPGLPGSTAKTRGRKIDRKISAAMSFVSAMSSADVNVDQIFKELARQKIYGEVAEEAAWITRDTELLGVDILTAIRNGSVRSPSKRFQDFLQGVVTTATSGGQLKPYFLLKAEQYERENKLAQLQRVETMGLLAETFVTVVVAFPLFLVIIIAIFAIIGGGGTFMIDVLWAIVGLMIPLSQFGFIFFMYTLAQEM